MSGKQATLEGLRLWRESLVALDRGNKLVKFKSPKTSSLTFDLPDPNDILASLRSGSLLEIYGDEPETEGISSPQRTMSKERLHSPRPSKDIGPVVRTLSRTANEEFLDRGLSVLYVAFGILRWKDTDGSEMASPLYLLPVELVRDGPSTTPRLRASQNDHVLNPVLPLRLADFGVRWPSIEDVEGLQASEIFELFQSSIAEAPDFKDWEILPEVHLSTFHFMKEAMYRDLIDNEDEIANHPVVQALANTDPTSQTTEFQFDPVNPDNIDEEAPPERTPLVLDADSSQRAAIAASLAGRSFVMDGPPGTGKSQTIANMIGALMHAGKSVLFVSEKIAALDVVRHRLQDAGLESYLLELHSHNTSRRDVAAELLRTLENVPQPPAGMKRSSRENLMERRKKLTAYAMAMNDLRSPLNSSLHDVLGRLAELTNVPSVPDPKQPLVELDESGLTRLRTTLKQLERTWRPAVQGTSFLWRGVRDKSPLESKLRVASRTLQELRSTMSLNSSVMSAFGLDQPAQAHELMTLLELQHNTRRLQVNDQWLVTRDWAAVEADRQQLGDFINDFEEWAAKVIQLSGKPHNAFPEALPDSPVIPQVTGAIDVRDLDAAGLGEAIQYVKHSAHALGDTLRSLQGLAKEVGFPAPETWASVDRLIRAVELRNSGLAIEPTWLSLEGLQRAREAATVTQQKAMALDAAEERALSVYREDALKAPLHDLRDRFDHLHKGLRKLSSGYRRDKQVVAALLSDAQQVKAGIAGLSDAVAWQEASSEFEAASQSYRQVLGRHWKNRATDWEMLERALTGAEEIIALSSGAVTAQTISFFTASAPETGHYQVANAAKHAVTAWKESLVQPPAIGGRPELLFEQIESSLRWLEAHTGPLERSIKLVRAVNEVTGQDLTVADASAISQACKEARSAAEELEAAHEQFALQFGDLFRGAKTELSAVDDALSWARRIRGVTQAGVLDQPQANALAKSRPLGALPNVVSKWERAREEILDAFDESRRADLLEDFATFSGASEFLEELAEDTVGQQEWFEYVRIREVLHQHDLIEALEFCIRAGDSASRASKAIEKSILKVWADDVIGSDARLNPLRATDRDALVEEFRDLDQDLVNAATSEIIVAANAKRPVNTDIGDPGLIRREGNKQRRNIAVRELISRARSAVQSIKPVFMMSPLTVSQYLPSNLRFDVVIFDEASQVTPGDSINCIYRADSFVLAGDDKQLPPTQFFERAVEVSDDADPEADLQDFQSILELAKSTGAFQNIGLRWHYRSQHESLIAFSNYRFYEGKLITYPSAQEDGPNVGVEFYRADGMYRRGGGADNPKEAQLVAERVIHHYRSRPNSSLGVVTFSVAQASAVQAALDSLREQNRDLDGYFDRNDRLGGFFVRSLESVQGDERDVIIFSVGYGPDEAGKISTNFGVLNKDKGWRRLNVGVTRARQRVEVISSMEASDIPFSSNENVEALRSYLDFAQRGISTLGTQSSATGAMPESPFEESVIRTIESWGYNIEPQVGAAGFRIDMAVRHPEKPGLFVLGVECDGYQYHSSPTARDRDRLRDQVLGGLGWSLHRIWGTAWYRDRSAEEKRLRSAIEAAISGKSRAPGPKKVEPTRIEVETTPVQDAGDYTWTADYEVAPRVHLPSYVDLTEADSFVYMVEPIKSLVEIEGPIHIEVINERIRDWWNIGRVSRKMKDNLVRAIDEAELRMRDDFVDMPGRPVTCVRCRGNTRKPTQVDLEEFVLAGGSLVADVGSVSRHEVVKHIARLFGWARNGASLDERLNRAVDLAVESGHLIELEGMLSAPPRTA